MAVTPVSPPTTRPHRKKIVLCCDGTGNEFGAPNPDPADKQAGCNSNVVKLYTALQIDNDQVGYYHPGVGTMGAPAATHWWAREWSKIKGLAFGVGFRENVLDAYRYLMETYSDNGGYGNEDEVYIFGFSRGAYTARALAGLLHGYGLLCKGNEGHIPYAWRMYVAQHDHRRRNCVEPDTAFKETFSHKNFKIQFVGVWDTVSSVGWISTPLRLFNVAQNDIILRGRHAVSIDEHRCFFQDNLWGDPLKGQDLLQVWFAGVHSDVGGSYLQPESGLSDIAFRWMLDEVGIQPGADGKYRDGPGIRLNKAHLDLVLGKMPVPEVDPELLYIPPACSKLHNSLTGVWWLLEFIPHLYYNKDNDKEQRRVPLGLRRRQLPAGSLVHESVAKRMETAAFNYKPKNVSRTELVRIENDPVPLSAGGTKYYRFIPKDCASSGIFFELFDRFVVTWFFTIFDIMLLPVIVWVALLVATSVLVPISRLVAASVCLTPRWILWPWHVFIHWFDLLVISLLHYLHWIRHV
jgi:T6SS, Phospholipase effector Tle1-like, catalytic domain